jgi:hypothetical protein
MKLHFERDLGYQRAAFDAVTALLADRKSAGPSLR